MLHASEYLLLLRSGQKTYKAHYYNHMYETPLSEIEGKRHICIYIKKIHTRALSQVFVTRCYEGGISYTSSDIHNTLKNQAFKNHTYSCKNKVSFLQAF